MIDKIDQLGALNNENNKPDKVRKKIRPKDIASKKVHEGKTDSDGSKGEAVAKVEISQAAKEQLLLRAEAERYLKMVESQEGIDPDKVEELKQKVSDNFYLKEKVIDKIVDKLLNLPGFQNKE